MRRIARMCAICGEIIDITLIDKNTIVKDKDGYPEYFGKIEGTDEYWECGCDAKPNNRRY